MDWAASNALTSLLNGDSTFSLGRLPWRAAGRADNPYLAAGVRSVLEATERLKQIQHFLEAGEPRGRHDGVACFNQVLYVLTTRLGEGVSSGYFADARFVEDLGVRLCNRYLEVLQSEHLQAGANPVAWRALLERRDELEVPGILYAVAGLNALINYDLPGVLTDTLRRSRFHRTPPRQRQDYANVGDLAAQEVEEMHEHFSTSLIRAIDPQAHQQVSAALANWSVREAWDAAWRNAQLLLRLRDHGVDRKAYLQSLDGLVGMSNRLLLVPTP